jgi:small subunit ribosomal protein S3
VILLTHKNKIMTHVANPFSQRLGIIRDWRSRWYVGAAGGTEYVNALRGDVLLREFLNKTLRGMYVAEIIMERSKDMYRMSIHTSRPGMIIGKGGDGIEKLRASILKEAKRKKITIPANFKLDIVEVNSPESSAAIVGYMVAEALEKRLPFRRILKTTAEKVMASRDVQGVRIGLSGRLGGAEMARREEIRKGNVPLQTLRADVDFTKERANMTYGVIGIKVWIYKGMKFDGIEADKQSTRAPRYDRAGGQGGADRPRRPYTPRDPSKPYTPRDPSKPFVPRSPRPAGTYAPRANAGTDTVGRTYRNNTTAPAAK